MRHPGAGRHRVETAGTSPRPCARADWDDLRRHARPQAARRHGRGTAAAARELAPDAAVIIVTGYADLQGAIAALRQGAADYILKPIDPDALRASLAARSPSGSGWPRPRSASETAFRTLVEAAPCHDRHPPARLAHVAYFSRFAQELTGYRGPEVLGKDFLALFMPAADRADDRASGMRSGCWPAPTSAAIENAGAVPRRLAPLGRCGTPSR